jgi:hypothetical protein
MKTTKGCGTPSHIFYKHCSVSILKGLPPASVATSREEKGTIPYLRPPVLSVWSLAVDLDSGAELGFK